MSSRPVFGPTESKNLATFAGPVTGDRKTMSSGLHAIAAGDQCPIWLVIDGSAGLKARKLGQGLENISVANAYLMTC